MSAPKTWPNPDTGGVSSMDDQCTFTLSRHELAVFYRALDVASDHAGEVAGTLHTKTEVRRVLLRLHDRVQDALWDLDGVPKKERIR